MIRASSSSDLAAPSSAISARRYSRISSSVSPASSSRASASVLARRRPGPPRVHDRLQLGVAPARVAETPRRSPDAWMAGKVGLESIQLRGELTELLEHARQANGACSGAVPSPAPRLRTVPARAHADPGRFDLKGSRARVDAIVRVGWRGSMPGMARDGRQDRSDKRAESFTRSSCQPAGSPQSVAVTRPRRPGAGRARSCFDANGDGVIENWSIAHGGDSFANFDPPPSGAIDTTGTQEPSTAGARSSTPRPCACTRPTTTAHASARRPRFTTPTTRTNATAWAAARRANAGDRAATPAPHRSRARAAAPAVARSPPGPAPPAPADRRPCRPAGTGLPVARTSLRGRPGRPRTASRSRRASCGSRRCRRGRPSPAAWPGTRSRRSAAAGDPSAGLRAITASMTGASRCSLSRCSFSSRSANSGSTSRPNSSSASMMCSWRFLPAWKQKITWSTPHSS